MLQIKPKALCIPGTCLTTELEPPTLSLRQGLVIMLRLPVNSFQTYVILLSQLLKDLGLQAYAATARKVMGLFVFVSTCFYFSSKILKCHILLNVILQSDNQVCLKLLHITYICIVT